MFTVLMTVALPSLRDSITFAESALNMCKKETHPTCVGQHACVFPLHIA